MIITSMGRLGTSRHRGKGGGGGGGGGGVDDNRWG